MKQADLRPVTSALASFFDGVRADKPHLDAIARLAASVLGIAVGDKPPEASGDHHAVASGLLWLYAGGNGPQAINGSAVGGLCDRARAILDGSLETVRSCAEGSPDKCSKVALDLAVRRGYLRVSLVGQVYSLTLRGRYLAQIDTCETCLGGGSYREDTPAGTWVQCEDCHGKGWEQSHE